MTRKKKNLVFWFVLILGGWSQMVAPHAQAQTDGKRVLMPVPNEGFDPTEAAVAWKILARAGIRVTFATPDGRVAKGDPIMVTGKKLGLLKPFLRADRNGRLAYREMIASEEFRNPVTYASLSVDDYDGVVLPGGHAPEIRPYLESSDLQRFVADFHDGGKPLGAICHGVVLAARSISRETGKSILYGRKTTALPEHMELLAWKLTKLWLGNYYRTYPVTVEAEVKSVLAHPNDFIVGPRSLLRDSPRNLSPGFVVEDGNYLSARWPGDAHRFATAFVGMLRAAQTK